MRAVVFGLFETGLGVIRSLGQKGIKVIGVDFRKDIAWYSRYVKPMKCPHPIQQEESFIEWIRVNFSHIITPLPVFLTSDDFFLTFSRNRKVLSKYFIFNLAEHELLENISDKYQQFLLAQKTGTEVPVTFLIHNQLSLHNIPAGILKYPLFIKGNDVNPWRKIIGGTIKGFLVRDEKELNEKITFIMSESIPVIIQEVITGPDTNHYKYCSYTSKAGNILAEFTLQKIRQNPIHFGVGAVVESIGYTKLVEEGRKLFRGISFKGIGSAEFKKDERDGKLKLIEINPRYWQQNYLSTACGINFPYINYTDLMQRPIQIPSGFTKGIKWVNRYMDFDSFCKYRKEDSLSFRAWRNSLKGKKVYSDFTWDDPIPGFYEIGFGKRLIRLPLYLCKRVFSSGKAKNLNS